MSALEIRSLTVGPVQENTYVVARAGEHRCVVVDPGEEAPRILAVIEEAGLTVEAILLTHCHFDHTGAVGPVARATGAPVYCPVLEVAMLQDVMAFVPWPGFGPYENHDPEHTVAGGERLELAGIAFDVVFTPGHSPGHVTYAAEDVLLSGDVLFESSIGRTDLPGGDHATLLRSIAGLLDAYPDETTVLPGHMGITTLGRERATNPFLTALASR